MKFPENRLNGFLRIYAYILTIDKTHTQTRRNDLSLF